MDSASAAGYPESAHFLFDEQGGFAANMKMFSHDPDVPLSSHLFGDVKEWTTRAPMLALSDPDPALGFPAGTTLQPKVFVRNTSAKTYAAHLRFNWRSATTSGKTSPINLVLKPNATHVVDVAALQAQNLIPADAHWAGVTLSAPVQPDDLMAVAASYDQTGRYGAQTPFGDQLASHWEGGQWEVDSMHNSLITIGNGGSNPARAELTLLYNHGGEQYRIEKSLAPGEQAMIDFGKLIRGQIPDKDGHVLPPDLTSGAYRLRDLADPAAGSLYEGKVIVDKTHGHAAYGCMICCGPEEPSMQYDPINLIIFLYEYQQVNASNSCGGGVQIVTGDFPTWWTDNTSIATANRNKITGAGAGSTTHYAQSKPMYWGFRENASYCPTSQPVPSAGTDVLSLSCTSTVTRGSSATCTVTGPSGTTVSGWKFVDGSNNTVNRSQNTTSLTWSGTMVTSGTVSVTATVSGASTPLSAGVTVNNRTNFAFATVQPNKETNPYTCVSNSGSVVLSVNNPPQPAGGNNYDYIGKYCDIEDYSYNFLTLSDNGPNSGYSYITAATSNASFHWIIAQDADNPSSTFYKAQCGNYNAANSTGYISGAQLDTNTIRHESAIVQGHYGNYVTTQNNSNNNVGTGLESAVNLSSGTTFQNWVTSDIAPRITALHNGTQSPEPYDVNHDQNGVYDGPINFSPYAACQ